MPPAVVTVRGMLQISRSSLASWPRAVSRASCSSSRRLSRPPPSPSSRTNCLYPALPPADRAMRATSSRSVIAQGYTQGCAENHAGLLTPWPAQRALTLCICSGYALPAARPAFHIRTVSPIFHVAVRSMCENQCSAFVAALQPCMPAHRYDSAKSKGLQNDSQPRAIEFRPA